MLVTVRRPSLLVIVLLVALPLAGLVAGFMIGDAVCDDPYYQSYPDFRCLDEEAVGSGTGLATGVLLAVGLTVGLARRYRRRRTSSHDS
jgi:hypothetical protein